MRSAIAAQCFGMLGQQMLAGGILLLYLNALGAGPATILMVLNLTPFLTSILSIPLGWGADRIGIKRFGRWGNLGMIAGLSLVASAASLGHSLPNLVIPLILAGLVVHTVGATLFNTGWFSLLSHLVPTAMTGRYFGVLRFSWQLVSLLFFAVSAAFFSSRTPLWAYQVVLATGIVSVACRSVFYRTLPEAPAPSKRLMPISDSVRTAMSLQGFAPFLGYLLLLVCVTGNGPDMLRLSAVRGCGLGDDQVLFLTVGTMAGSLAGFAFIGHVIDHLGPRAVFFGCHLGFAIALSVFPLRDILHLAPFQVGIAASFLLGLANATLGLATTSQSFRICTGSQRTMAYALVSSVQTFGSGVSGFALAALLNRMGHRVPGWNPFDQASLGLAAFVLLQIAALGLLPGNSDPNAPREPLLAFPRSKEPDPARIADQLTCPSDHMVFDPIQTGRILSKQSETALPSGFPSA
jgi:MFS family permease